MKVAVPVRYASKIDIHCHLPVTSQLRQVLLSCSSQGVANDFNYGNKIYL